LQHSVAERVLDLWGQQQQGLAKLAAVNAVVWAAWSKAAQLLLDYSMAVRGA